MRRLILVSILVALAGCVTSGGPPPEAVRTARDRLEAAFAAGDPAAMAALYTEDAAVLAPNLPRIAGRAAIQRLWQDFLDGGVTSIAFTPAEVTAWGADAAEDGELSLSGSDGRGGTATIRGKYILLWRLETDGAWRLRRQIWNNDPSGRGS